MSERKPKAIIFGAGNAGCNYLSNYNGQFNFIAFCDNDPNKYGTLINELIVIGPNQIQDYKYDCIIVASMYAHEIRNQLVEQLSVPESKLIFPTKGDLKQGQPFMDDRTRALGRKVILSLSQILDAHGINLFLDYGTLLGVVREGDILKWDDDIDLSVNDDQFDLAYMTLKSNLHRLPGPGTIKWQCGIKHNYDGKAICIDLNFICPPSCALNSFEVGIRLRKHIGEESVPMGSVEDLKIPFKHFDGHEIYQLDGAQVKVPRNVEGYLTSLYGDWKTPKPGFRFIDYEENLNKSHFHQEFQQSLNTGR